MTDGLQGSIRMIKTGRERKVTLSDGQSRWRRPHDVKHSILTDDVVARANSGSVCFDDVADAPGLQFEATLLGIFKRWRRSRRSSYVMKAWRDAAMSAASHETQRFIEDCKLWLRTSYGARAAIIFVSLEGAADVNRSNFDLNIYVPLISIGAAFIDFFTAKFKPRGMRLRSVSEWQKDVIAVVVAPVKGKERIGQRWKSTR